MDDDQVAELLTRALKALDTAAVPDDLRETAFTAALGLLTRGQDLGAGGSAPPPASPTTKNTGGQTGGGTPASSGSTLLDHVAEGLDLEPAVVGRVFAEKNGAPEVSIKSSRLPKTASAGAYDIALLVMAGRQLSGIEETTEAATLRDACKAYSTYDQSNFGKHMKALDRLVRTEGRGHSAKRRLTRPGIEAAARLVEQYATDKVA